jgi:hypothetical protein
MKPFELFEKKVKMLEEANKTGANLAPIDYETIAILEQLQQAHAEIAHMKSAFAGQQDYIENMRKELYQAHTERDALDECLQEITQWCNAYSLTVFPEPDLKKAHELLKAGGITLDAVSASAMRHVLEGVAKIIEATRKEIEDEIE